jgi:hypothetical protein
VRAGACGFTPQYAELQGLYNKYSSKGLVVLGFPCNQVSVMAGERDNPPVWLCLTPSLSVVWCRVDVSPQPTVWCPGARLQL